MQEFAVGDAVIFEYPGSGSIAAIIRSITPGINTGEIKRHPIAKITGPRISGDIEVPLMYLRK